jgi:hypothetical protein
MIKIVSFINVLIFIYVSILIHFLYKSKDNLKLFINKTYKIIIFILIYIIFIYIFYLI